MPSRDQIDTKDRAARALRAGRPEEALPLFRSLLTHAVMMEPGVYESWLEGTLGAYRAMGRKREAGCVLMGLGRYGQAEKFFSPDKHPIEWSVCAAEQGRRGEAADCLIKAGFPVLAGIQLEADGDHAGARKVWQGLLGASRLRAHSYETALCHMALARSARKLDDDTAARDSETEAVRILETLADDFETRGLRERAFDCHCLILRLGREHGSFENIAEGYTNAIRILMAEYDPYVPLQYSDDFIEAASKAGEWQAAALTALEAADYSRRMDLSFGRHYLARAARLWIEASGRVTRANLAPEIAENALAAALDAAANLSDLPLLGKIYTALAELPVAAERRERYATLASRYSPAGEPTAPEPGVPDHLKQSNPYVDIGTHDLAEWELAGDPVATLVLILVDHGNPVRFRRQALRALLIAIDGESPSGVELALALGAVPLYQVLAPLDALFNTNDANQRVQVMASVGKVLNKPSFRLVRKGLDDPDERVREEARRALRGLKFRDGLDPLIRIYQETRDQAVRETALAAIADIGTLQAAMFLLDVVREGSAELRALAADRLTSFRPQELLPHVRAELQFAAGAERTALRNVVAALEVAGG